MTKLQLAGAAMCVLMAASLGACNKAEPAKPAVDTAKISDAIKADVAQRIAAVEGVDLTGVQGFLQTDARGDAGPEGHPLRPGRGCRIFRRSGRVPLDQRRHND